MAKQQNDADQPRRRDLNVRKHDGIPKKPGKGKTYIESATTRLMPLCVGVVFLVLTVVLGMLARRYGLLLGVGAGLCGVGTLTFLGVYFWRTSRNRRLIFTKNAVQVVDWSDTLIGHVPYNNIGYINVRPEFHRGDTRRSPTLHVEMHLIDPDREDWIWFQEPPAESNADVNLSRVVATNQQRLLRVLSKTIKKSGHDCHVIDWTPR